MYLKRMVIVSVPISIVFSLLYYLKLIKNIRSVLSDLTTFTGALFGFFIVIFTILLGNEYNKLYSALDEHGEKNVREKIFNQLKQILLFCLTLFIYIFIIRVLDTNNYSIYIKSSGIFILSFLISMITFGAYLIISDMLRFFSLGLKDNKLEKEE